jgi:ABC-2 type transport system ATP-binding protein
VPLVIETDGLSKHYGAVHAVDSVSLRLARGEIYGFLGLNGAGKTTTIRLLLGMIRPSGGSLRLFGQAVGPNGRGPWSRVGHLVESPSAYPQLSVRENLEVCRRLHGMSDVGAVSRLIEQLALAPYADRKAGTLSSGNLQRLGLARAMLHVPELLILDEPANGLDPAGVVEIRELLRSMARERGVAVFMSSHILPEVDRLATRIGIIHKGRVIEELDAGQVEELRFPRLEVTARKMAIARAALVQAGFEVEGSESTLILRQARAVDAPDEVAAILAQAGAPPTRLTVQQEDLESHFLRLTGERA